MANVVRIGVGLPLIKKPTVLIPDNALLDETGNPLLDETGEYLLDES